MSAKWAKRMTRSDKMFIGALDSHSTKDHVHSALMNDVVARTLVSVPQ